MKEKLLKALMVSSLFVAGSLFAIDEYSAFYPSENNDSPSYAISDTLPTSDAMAIGDLGIEPDHMDTFSKFYPLEDNDSPSYAMDDTLDFDNLPATASGGEMEMGDLGIKSDHMDSFKAFYPLEDDDSARY